MSQHYSIYFQMKEELGREPTQPELKERILEIIRAATKKQMELHEQAKKGKK